MPPRKRTNDPIAVSLPRLLDEEGLSFRQLARTIGVSQSYLSRIRNARDSEGWRPPSKKLLISIADELGVAPDYFPEFREVAVEEAIAADGRLRDRFFDSLPRSRRTAR